MPSPRSRRAAKLSSLSTGRVGAEPDDAAPALAVLAGIDDTGVLAGAGREPGGLDVERADALAAAATRSTARRTPAGERAQVGEVGGLARQLARTRSRASPRVQLSSPATSVAPRRPFAIDSA